MATDQQDVWVYHHKKTHEIFLMTSCNVKEGKLVGPLPAHLIIRFGPDFWSKVEGWNKNYGYAVTPIHEENWFPLTDNNKEQYQRGLPSGVPLVQD